ncbi:putative pectinesterase 63 [Alnus glutinosa]|uniref:putative pectinesterase 63 n=1 Tax=Alnus glutinosa TaxID=3517 RepID=UPI002D79AB4B|nr:putative pectinesterase 63 [Alnus glutinosa]
MALKLTHLAAPASFLATLLVLQLLATVVSVPTTVPSDTSKLDAWIKSNMREYKDVSATKSIDQALLIAEKKDNVKVIRVKKDGTGDFKTITDAVKSVPSGNTKRVIIKIGRGEYKEMVKIDRSKPFITFYGEPGNMPRISYDGTAKKYGTWYCATVAVESNYFVAVNIAFVNSAPAPDPRRNDQQAVAMRISGDKAAFHNCKFIGYQDTLCDDVGRHFFRDCYIQGTVDFIFGNGKSVYLNTTINSVAKGLGVITAQAREKVDDVSGFTFIYCKIIGTGDTYLGRAWRKMPRVVFAFTEMGTLINSKGWSNTASGQAKQGMYYGEYKCKGPGATPAGRVKYAKILSDAEAAPFLSMTFIQGNKWILAPPKL